MQSVEVKKQASLSLAKCIELVLSGIKYRLFRSAVTVVIIALAVAFLMTMLSESIVTRQVGSAITQQTRPRNLMGFWLSYISTPMTPKEVRERLAQASAGSDRWKEFQAWGGLTDEQMNHLARLARLQLQPDAVRDGQAVAYQAWFDDLNEGVRRPLVGRARGEEVFESLQDAKVFQQLQEGLLSTGKPFPSPLEEFSKFLADWNASRPLIAQIIAGHTKAIADLKAATKRTSPERLLAQNAPTLMSQLEKVGFAISPADLSVVAGQALISQRTSQITSTLRVELLKRRLADRRNVLVSDANDTMLFEEVASSGGAQWFKAILGDPKFTDDSAKQGLAVPSLSVEEIQQTGRIFVDQEKLRKVEAPFTQQMDKAVFMGFSSRTLWLIVVSFVVCVVGIANAMLMSVTERFREIATMKCLGATDGFIMINFILESCLQGTAGGLVGALLGFLLGVLRSWASYGWIAIQNLPLMEMLGAALISMVVGLLLSALAAVYPAFIAARLAPMEAMRIE